MKLAIVDTETTGLWPSDGHRVIEFACALVELTKHGMATRGGFEFRTRIDLAKHAWQKKALEVNGYDTGPGGAWERAPEVETPDAVALWRRVATELEGFDPCAQNVPFDMDFMEHETRRHGVISRWPRRHVEVMSYSAIVADEHDARDYGLEAAYDLLGLPPLPRHRAAADVARCKAVIAHVWRRQFPATWRDQ